MPALFEAGTITMTPEAKEAFSPYAMTVSLRRHLAGDWGDVEAIDAKENDAAIKNGLRILSAYRYGARWMWIITEGDRSATVISLHEDQ